MEQLRSPLGWVKPFRCGRTLSYLVSDELLVDAPPQIERSLVSPKKIFITHEHWVHFGGVGAFNCPAFARDVAAEAIRAGDKARLKMPEDAAVPNKEIGQLKDGEHIEAGNMKLSVIFTPGHSAGSTALFEEESGTLFSGDTVFANSSIPHHTSPTGSLFDLVSTYEKLSQLKITWVFPGHGLIFKDNGSIMRTLGLLRERQGTEDTQKVLDENIHDESMRRALKDTKAVAVVGLSRSAAKPSRQVAEYLKRERYKIIPINPGAAALLGEKCYPSLSEAAQHEKIDAVCVFLPPSKTTAELARDAKKTGAKYFWMQPGAENEEAEQEAVKAGLIVFAGKCMMQEHRRLVKISGK